jgi:hypothetical protein
MSSLKHISVLLLLAFLLGARPVSAQSPGNITVFADQTASSCSIADVAPGTLTVYVIHTNFSEKNSSDFRVSASSGFHAGYVGESYNPQLGHVGDFQNGISFGYGVCMAGPLLLGTISYQGFGTSESCSYLDVVAWRFPWPDTQDCIFEDYPAPPLGKLVVNPTPQCQPYCLVATEPMTWGSVKALYRD